MSDEQITAFVNDLSRREKEKKGGKSGLTLKKILIPYTDSKLGFLSQFDENFQRLVLIIRRELNAVNEDIELAWYYFKQTFESHSDINRQLIEANLNTTYLDLAGKTRRLADRIEELQSERNF